MKLKLTTLLVMLTVLLASCGFHLRQNYNLNPQLSPAYLTFKQPYSEFALILKDSLQQNNLEIVASEEEANSHIRILNTALSHSSKTRGPSNQSQVYNYRFTVKFDVLDNKGEQLIAKSRVSASERLALRPNQLIHTNNQLSELKRKLYRRVANLLIMKLQK